MISVNPGQAVRIVECKMMFDADVSTLCANCYLVIPLTGRKYGPFQMPPLIHATSKPSKFIINQHA